MIGARMKESPMAGVRYFEQSFFSPFWQNIVDFNAELIEIPLGTLSPDQNGFAFENVDGTYTACFGAVTFNGNSSPSGQVTDILRLSSIAQAPTIGTTLTTVNGNFSANLAYEAYRDGGTEFYAYIFDGGDSIGFEAPASLGPLGQSPLIETFDGDDVVDGSLHSDTIFAGSGDDEVNGRGGNDEIHGGAGFDDLFGGAGADFLDGGADNDRLYGNGGDDFIDGGEGIDSIWGGDGHDIILGGAGNFIDSLRGGNGNDTLIGGGGADVLRGGNGGDAIDGGAGGDFIFGQDGTDIIYGQQGDDFIQGGNGNDTIRGGSGFDTVTFNRDLDAYEIDFSGDSVFVTDLVGSGGTDELMGVERIVFADGEILV
jgi:Ca2+-binding RTX toxin-like protein